MKWLLCAAALLTLLGGCYQPQEPVSLAHSESMESSGIVSSSTQGDRGSPSSSSGIDKAKSSSSLSGASNGVGKPDGLNISSAASSGVSSAPPSSSSGTSSDIGSASESSSGTAETPGSQEAPNLWQLVQIAFEKPVYGAESARLYFQLTNNSSEPVYIMRTYQVEQEGENGWIPLGGEQDLDNPGIQYPVEPGETRLVGVYVGWMKQPNERYGDERIPEGSYRIQICLNRGYWFEVPFYIQPDPLEQDTTAYEIRTVNRDYLTTSEYIDYEIINKTSQELAFGYACSLEKWNGEVWQRCEGENVFPEISIILMPGKTTRESFPLSGYASPLEPGRYRLVKTLRRNYYYAEFTVDTKVARPVEDLVKKDEERQ